MAAPTDVRDVRRARPPQVLDLTGEKTPLLALLGDLWRARGLLVMLAGKEYRSRYRSAALGVLWAVLLPFLQGAVLAVVFTRFVKVGLGQGTSYAAFAMSGTVLWAYISGTISVGSTTIVDQGAIAGKLYFPRLILPGVPVLAGSVGFGISAIVLLPVMLLVRAPIHASLLLFPAAMLLCLLAAYVFSAALSLLHVYFRDVKFFVQASILVLFYATPIIYPIEKTGSFAPYVLANPFAGILNLARYAITGTGSYLVPGVLATTAWVLGLGTITAIAYSRHERIAVDRL